MKFVILAIFAIFVAQSFHIAGKILLTFAIFSKFADFSKPFLTFSLSKCRILWNSEFQVLNSRFYFRVTWTPHLNCQRESGFQSPGFQISQSKFLRFRNPIYHTWGYMHCFATTYSFTIITINLEILERSLLGSYFLKLYLDWKRLLAYCDQLKVSRWNPLRNWIILIFRGLQLEPFLRSYFIQLITFIALKTCEKECNMLEVILVKGFCPLKIKISQFPNGFCLKVNKKQFWGMKLNEICLSCSIKFAFTF